MREINLDTLSNYYINVEGQTARLNSIEQLVKEWMPKAPQSIRWRGATCGGNAVINCSLSHLQIMASGLALQQESSAFTPFAVLEDDCQATQPRPNFLAGRGGSSLIQIPDDADLLYLGISDCAAHATEDRYMPHTLAHRSPVGHEFPGVYKVSNMLSSHSYVVCSERFIHHFSHQLKIAVERNIHLDVLLARQGSVLNFYALADPPLFFQASNLKGQEEPTRLCWKSATLSLPVQPAFVTMIDLGSNGRLGNQMFQYAFLVSVAAKYQTKLRLSTKQFTDCRLQVAFQNVWFEELSDTHCVTLTVTEHEHMTPLEIPLCVGQLGTGVNFKGYFQSETNFSESILQVKECFQFKHGVSKSADEILAKIRGNDAVHLVGLHVRLGDNLTENHPYSRITPQYCKQAIEHIKKCINSENIDVRVVIVSESHNRDQIRSATGLVNLDNDVNANVSIVSQSDYEDMCLLTKCDSLIMSCSSFSWWAAWLGSRDRPVVCPVPWYNQKVDRFRSFDTSQLFLKEWHQIPV